VISALKSTSHRLLSVGKPPDILRGLAGFDFVGCQLGATLAKVQLREVRASKMRWNALEHPSIK
jgi:hypothetical protein